MSEGTRPVGEEARLDALRRYDVLDTPEEAAFDSLTELAARLCGDPIALVNLIDEARAWIKSAVGFPAGTSSPREDSFCAHTVAAGDLVVVPDTLADPRFAANPFVLGPPHVRFYAGAPLVTPDGHALGTLCVFDTVARELAPDQAEVLRLLAQMAMSQLELRRRGAELEAEVERRRASEERLAVVADVVESSEDAIYSRDRHGRITSWNGAAERIFGWPAEEMLGTSHFVAFNDGADGREALERSLRGEVIVGLETVGHRRDGSSVELSFSQTPIRNASGSVVGAAIVARDVSERNRTERALQETAARLSVIVGNMPIVVWSLDRDGRFILSEGKALEALGRVPGQVVGLTVEQVHADQPHLVAQQRRVLAGAEEIVQMEVGDLAFEGFAAPLRDEAGAIVGSIGVAADVTTRVAAERENRLLENQLNQTQRLESVGRLAGGIAHDFNNLLAVILNYAEFVLEDLEDGSPLAGDVEEIRSAAARAAELTRQLLVFSRREVVQPVQLDLGRVVGDVETLLARTLGEDVALSIEVAPVLDPVLADPSQLEQVLLNLAINARDAMPSGGHLTIAVENAELSEEDAAALGDVRAGAHVRVRVADTGCGMDEEVLAHALEPFFTTKAPEDGTGLGLASAYGIARGSDGTIVLSSTPGIGTTVDVVLPAAACAQAPAGEPAPEPQTGPRRVLVVEDEDAVRELTRRILVRQGYEVLTAKDGPTALAVEEDSDGEIHLVLSDVVMPGMSGPVVAEQLRERLPGLAVVFMSGYNDDVVLRHGAAEGEVALVQKPFTSEVLTVAVDHALRAHARTAS